MLFHPSDKDWSTPENVSEMLQILRDLESYWYEGKPVSRRRTLEEVQKKRTAQDGKFAKP